SCGFYMIQLNNGSIECRFINSANTLYEVVAPNFTTVPQVWQHFAWVYNGSSLSLYVNGSLSGTAPASGSITNTVTPFAIGKSILSGFNFLYNGRIDEVSVWNKALSQTEIQDMMDNELTGTEPNLKMYYKFNQGVPGADNTGISALLTEVNTPTYDGDLLNFALNGATSNFNGTLNASFQSISFPPVPTKLTSDPPFNLTASSTSGLAVSYTVLSGPATVNGNTVTLNGTPGAVTIQADQAGNGTFDPAAPVSGTFNVVDPAANVAVIVPLDPLNATDVYMPELGTMQLAAMVTIPDTPLFAVQSVEFIINGQSLPATAHANNHYTAWWTPPAYGAYTIQISSTSNFGAVITQNVDINVVQSVSDINNVVAFNGLWLDSGTPSLIASGNLPSYVGAFDTIIATLSVTCPTGGCDPWDRVASVDVMSKEGEWFEVIRYITPYGVPCSHNIDLADYMSMLQGKVTFRANCLTLTNGYVYELKFNFKQGAPAHKYSKVQQVWKTIYPFGDYANLQPVPAYNFSYPELAVASRLKLVSTGHGWGTLNTSNAAEFYNATHDIQVNGVNAFSQHNWTTCNPNPDGCSPQNGTWTYNRAGWCPGSIAKPFDYDMTPYISTAGMSLDYKFLSTYVDQCHPDNPNCVTGTTCSDCNDGFNPTLDVNCNLITWFDNPDAITAINDIAPFTFVIYPNPSSGTFILNGDMAAHKNYTVTVFDVMGHSIKSFKWNGQKTTMDLSNYSKGVYLVEVRDQMEKVFKKVVVE
ncbi:MAG: LamG-like jellyroll fold domain-containing protein, partial [Chitinophagales bacterium]